MIAAIYALVLSRRTMICGEKPATPRGHKGGERTTRGIVLACVMAPLLGGCASSISKVEAGKVRVVSDENLTNSRLPGARDRRRQRA